MDVNVEGEPSQVDVVEMLVELVEHVDDGSGVEADVLFWGKVVGWDVVG